MDEVGIVLAMLLAVVASGYLVRMLPFAVPLPLMQIALGAAIAGSTGHGVRLEPHIFFLVFLPPLLFLTAGASPRSGCSATAPRSSNWPWAWCCLRCWARAF